MSEPTTQPTELVAPDAEAPGAFLAPPTLGDVPLTVDPPRRGRTRSVSTRVVHTAMATLVSRGATAIFLVLLTPLLFAGLGERLFGIYQLTQRLSQFGGLTNLGASTYLKIRLAEMYADDETEDRRKAIGECILQWGILLPVLAFWTILVLELISGRATISDSQAVAVIVLILLTPLTQVLSIGNVALFTHHLGYLGVPLWTGIGICASALAAAAAYAGYGIEGVAVALAAGTILNGLVSLTLARRRLPWFGVEWPDRREFLRNFGKSIGASVASVFYLGLQQLESLTFGLGAGPVMLTRLVFTMIGLQLLEILVRSFIGTGNYAIAPLVRDRDSSRLAPLRAEAHGNIIFIFAIATPIIIGLTPIVVPLWIHDAILLGPWIAAAVLLVAMFRLLAQFDAGLLDQARDFHWKNVAAALAVFAPGAIVGGLVFYGVAPSGWYWLLSAAMAFYFSLVALRCGKLLSIETGWTPLIIPIVGTLASALLTSILLESQASVLALIGASAGLSSLIAVLSMLHPRLAGPVRSLVLRLARATRVSI